MRRTLTILLSSFYTLLSAQTIMVSDNSSEKFIPYYEGEIHFNTLGHRFALNFIENYNIGLYTNTMDFSSPEHHLIHKEVQGFVNFLGSFGSNQNRHYVFAKNSIKKFLVIRYNLKDRKKEEKKLDFKLKGAVYLGHFVYKKNFYIISWKKNTRLLGIHIFDKNLSVTSKEIDISKGQFYEEGIPKETFPRISNSFEDPILNFGYGSTKLKQVFSDIPNSNKTVTSSNKFYLENGTLKITLDSNKDYSILIQINLDSFEANTNRIKKELGTTTEPFNLKSNSFLLKNSLFLLKGNKKTVTLSLFNLDNNNRHRLITFNNETPYHKEKNAMITEGIRNKYNLPLSEKKKDEDAQKRLNKIMKSANQVGFQVVENDSIYLITLGGYLKRTGGGAPMMGMPGTPGFGGMSFGFGYGGTFIRDESLNFYIDKNNSSLTYSDFENPYERMTDFLNEEYNDKAQKKTQWVTKFRIGHDYYLGYLDKNSKEYIIRKFN